jgi:hypothetical protein
MPADVVAWGLSLDYDEDPAWAEERLQAVVAEWSPAAVVVSLFPGLKRPLRWLREEAGAHGEDVVLADVQVLLERHPVLINVETGPADLAWANRALSTACGFFSFLGQPLQDGGEPEFTNLETTFDLLRFRRARP